MKRWPALAALALVMLAVVFVVARNSGDERKSVADTAKSNTRQIVKLKRQVLPIQRVLVKKDILRQGQRGLTGGRGPIGNAGVNGQPGRSGAAGNPGAQGIPGLLGGAGPQGPAGKDGKDGAQGPKGDTGPQGEPGVNGAPGAQGPPGAAPASFTFTFLATTYLCTDADQDGAYDCAAQ